MHPHKDAKKMIEANQYMKAFEVCIALRISLSTLKNMVSEGKLKRYRVGTKHNSPNLYKSEDVLKLVQPK